MKIRGLIVTIIVAAFAIASQWVKTSTGAPGLSTPAQKPPAASPEPKPPKQPPAT